MNPEKFGGGGGGIGPGFSFTIPTLRHYGLHQNTKSRTCLSDKSGGLHYRWALSGTHTMLLALVAVAPRSPQTKNMPHS